MNKMIAIGRLGADPESRAIQGGNLCNFSLAVSERYGDKEHTEWIRVVAFGKLADICIKHIRKGSQVMVEGKLQTRSWEDNSGQKRYSTEVVASTVQFLGSQPVKEPEDNDEIPY